VSLDAVFGQAIQLLNVVTKTVQETVRIRPWIGEDVYGKVSYGATRKYRGVVTRKEGESRLSDGRVIHVTAIIAFLRPVTPIGAVGRTEPIDVRDQIFLADDKTGPILAVEGPTDNPGTQIRYFQQVFLG